MTLLLKKKITPIFIVLFALVFISFLNSCSILKKKSATRKNALKKLHTFQLPDFSDDLNFSGLMESIDMSLSYLEKISPETVFQFGKDTYLTPHMIKSLKYFKYFIESNPSPEKIQAFIKNYYTVYKSTGNSHKKVLFTGYYEPSLDGSLEREGKYQYPVYPRPSDHTIIDLSLFSPDFNGKKIVARIQDNKVIPYYKRDEISDPDIFKSEEAPLAWVSDPIDLFFLQIQGSGKIFLNNGEVINIHYHTTNGHPYRSIGKYLIDENKIPREEMSMQRIRSYLNEHPEEMNDIFNYNPSYVFFKLEEDGPYGCLNVKLTPGRSIATDRRIFPSAGIVFITTQKPEINDEGSIDSWTDFGRFVLNQDTGGAIRGPGRADLFCGNGLYAEMTAGHMQHDGMMYFLILKSGI